MTGGVCVRGGGVTGTVAGAPRLSLGMTGGVRVCLCVSDCCARPSAGSARGCEQVTRSRLKQCVARDFTILVCVCVCWCVLSETCRLLQKTKAI